MTGIQAIHLGKSSPKKPITHFAEVQSHLVGMVKNDPNSSKVYTVAAAGNAPPALSSWAPGRPNAEYTASTGRMDGSSTSGAIKLHLRKGATYNFGAAYSYSYSGGKPAFNMRISDASGKLISTAKSNSLTWVATADGDYTVTMEVTAAKGGTASFSSYKLDATQLLSKIPSSSGDKNIDAVLAGGSYWWHPEGNVAKTSDVNVSDSIKQLEGASSTVYYGFLEGSESYLGSQELNGFAKMEDGQKAAVKTAFDYLSTLINVEFKYDESKSNIEFGTNNQTASAGYASYPLGNGGHPSILMLDNSDNPGNSSANLATSGGYGWETLVHEIGHAMGLKHPGPYNAGGGKAPPPYLTSAVDNRAMSIMSYNDPAASQILNVSSNASGLSYSLSASNPGTYQTYDIAALQYLYGANKSTVASDLAVNDSYNQFKTLWAPQTGGVALNASTTTRANVFDLRQGGYSSISVRATDSEMMSDIKSKILQLNTSDASATAASASIYSSLKATKNSKKVALSSTLYNGKNNLALSYGSSYSSVTGGTSSDKFYIGNYSTQVNGGDGSDTVFLMGTAKDWTINATKTAAISKLGITIAMRNIEAVAFYKGTEALVHA
jgi:hypothetical protein